MEVRIMANEENLKSLGQRTTSEQREIARKGGIKSGQTRRKKACMKQALEMILGMQCSNPKLASRMAESGIAVEDITNMTGLMFAVVMEGMKGNQQAVRNAVEIMGASSTSKQKAEELKQRKAEFEYRKEQDKQAAGIRSEGGEDDPLTKAIMGEFGNADQ